MPYGYTPPGRIVELNNLARLRRINGAFHGAVGAAMRYNLFTNERVLFDASPTTSDVMRGVVNYLFRYGALTPEQWGYTSLTLVDPPGGAQLQYDLGSGNTCVRFAYNTAGNTSLQQGFKLNCTTLFGLYPAFTNTSWHCNIVFKLDTALGVGVNSILFSPNGLNTVGLYLQGNNVVVMAADTLNDNWTTNTAPVTDGWAGAFHRILVINNSGYLSIYVDGTLQLMKDGTGVYTSNTIQLGRASGPHTPPAAEWTIGNASAHVNTMTFHLSSTTGYNTMQYKYIAVGDALTDPVVLNATIQLTEPDQIDSFTAEQVRPAFVIKSTQEDDSVQGYEYPVKIGLQYGDAGAIELNDENTRIFYAGYDGVSGGKVVQGVINDNTTLDPRYMNVEYAVRTNLTNAVTIKLPTFNRAYPGSWLYFYDVDGGASTKNVTIDPDNANTGYTLNGNTTAQTAITADWGAVEIFYDWYGNTDKNWILVKHAPTDMSVLYSNATNTTLGVPSGPGIFVFASCGATSKNVFLPRANTCAGKMFMIKRTDGGFNTILSAVKNAASGDNFDMPGVTNHSMYGQHDAYCYVSDGGTYWKTYAMCNHRTSEAYLNRSSTHNTDLSYDFYMISGNATANLPIVINGQGRQIWFKNTGNVTLTLDPLGSETIDNVATLQIRGRNKSVGITSEYGTNWSTLGYTNELVTNASTNSTIAYPARVVLANSSAVTPGITLTLPMAREYIDSCLSIKKVDSTANTITIDGNGTETIDGALTYVLSKQYQQVDLTSDGSNWHIIGITEQMNIANVVGNVTVGNALAVTGNSALTGTLNVNGAVQFNSTLNTTGDVIFSNTLNTTGAVIFSNTLNTTGAVIFSNTLNTTGAVIFSNTLNTAGITTGQLGFRATGGALVVNAAEALLFYSVNSGAVVYGNGVLRDVSFSNRLGDIVFGGGPGNTDFQIPGHAVFGAGSACTWPTTNVTIDCLGHFRMSGGAFIAPSANGVASVYTSATLGMVFAAKGSTEDFTFLQANGAGYILRLFDDQSAIFDGAVTTTGTGTFFGAVNINTTNGIDVNPGSDVSCQLVTVGVTNAPTLMWDEPTSVFYFDEALYISSSQRGEYTMLLVGPNVDAGNTSVSTQFNYMPNKAIEANATNYISGFQTVPSAYTYSINTGLTDSGFRAGLNFNHYTYNTNFKGTLSTQYGIRIETGMYIANANAVINDSLGVSVTFDSEVGTITSGYGFYVNYPVMNGTVTNKWGFYATGETKNYMSGSLRSGATQTITGNATLNTNATLVLCNCAANTTLTLTAANVNNGRDVYIKRIDANTATYTLTVDGNASETIDGSNTQTISAQYDSMHIRCDGSNWWIV